MNFLSCHNGYINIALFLGLTTINFLSKDERRGTRQRMLQLPEASSERGKTKN